MVSFESYVLQQRLHDLSQCGQSLGVWKKKKVKTRSGLSKVKKKRRRRKMIQNKWLKKAMVVKVSFIFVHFDSFFDRYQGWRA